MSETETERQGTREIEIKLAFDPPHLGAIEAHPLLAGAPSKKENLLSDYYDTEDHLLRKSRLALRVRRIGTRFVQGVKSMDGAGELFDRAEWEQEISGENPRLDLYAGTPLERFFTDKVRDDLVKLFRTDVVRTAYKLLDEGSEVELAIDVGTIEAAGRHDPISELELELHRGHPEQIFRLARLLADRVPLKLAVKTKAERGYDLAKGGAAAVERAASVVLDPDMSCREGFRAIGQNCLRQIIANETSVLNGDAEGVHQMRIGLRRLRAAISVFSKMLADAEQERIVAELKWIGRELGAARDVDVLQEDQRQRGADHAEAQRAITTRREEAYAAVKSALQSHRYRAAILDLAAWMEVGAWTSDERLSARRDRHVKTHAAKVLEKLSDYVRARGRHLRKLNPKKRHKVRIRGKRLRYAVEFFGSLYTDGKREERRGKALAALKDLQDELGALNDLAVLEAHRAGGDELEVLAARALPTLRSEAERHLDQAEESHARFAKTKPFWT
jgi:triphosphatase